MHQNISILKKKNFFSQTYRIPHLGNYLNLQQVFFVKDLHFLFKIKLAVLRIQTLSLLIYKSPCTPQKLLRVQGEVTWNSHG